MKDLFDVKTPFFKPLWRRILVAGFTLCWTLFELSNGAYFWAVLFGAIGVYLTWAFYTTDWESVKEDDTNKDDAS